MADQNRKYPVNYLIMHHAVSNDMINWDDYKVQKWFSDVGKNRAYKGISNSKHYFPNSKVMSYSQAHFCLHKYTKDGNKYGWRLTQLIDDVWNNVTWHAGNWPINQKSIGIETAGNYSNQYLDEKALMLVADFWRTQDKKLKGKTYIRGHSEVSKTGTACPGLILKQIPTLINMINNPDIWNAKLWSISNPGEKPTMRKQDNLFRILKGNWKTLLSGSKQIGAYKSNPAVTINTLKAKILALENKSRATKADYEKTIQEMKMEIEQLKISQGGILEQEVKNQITETNSIVKTILNFLKGIFKRS